jgi:hypothetical protein
MLSPLPSGTFSQDWALTSDEKVSVRRRHVIEESSKRLRCAEGTVMGVFLCEKTE